MRTIWKLPLHPGITEMPLPIDATVRLVAMERDMMQIWVELDPDAPVTKRRFSVHATGDILPNYPGAYVGAAFWQKLAFHVYELPT